MKVGYIGLGLMGKSMARNILKSGFPLVVHNRSQGAVLELSEEGAQPANSPAEVAMDVDIVITNLPDSPDVEMVALGKNGIIEGAHQGLIFIDNSTIKPSTARMIAEQLGTKAVSCLDAPVSGGDIGAKQGTLAIMVDRLFLERQRGHGVPVADDMKKGYARAEDDRACLPVKDTDRRPDSADRRGKPYSREFQHALKVIPSEAIRCHGGPARIGSPAADHKVRTVCQRCLGQQRTR